MEKNGYVQIPKWVAAIVIGVVISVSGGLWAKATSDVNSLSKRIQEVEVKQGVTATKLGNIEELLREVRSDLKQLRKQK